MGLGGLIAGVGAVLVMHGWSTIHGARGGLVMEGLYGRIRHPQYLGLALFVVGALVQWPTIPTLLMAPVLLVVYTRLARREEAELETRFGDAFREYRAAVPAFLPRVGSADRTHRAAPPHGLAAREDPVTPHR
jgi:protein-S-isoprenylcysteine O-methyltransferase Ste14